MTLDFQIIIDKEYQDLIPPLSTKDNDELKDSIREKGLLKPITLNEKKIIIDGHHRYKICQELGIIPTFVIKHFESEYEEIEYINDCNIKRRHLNSFQRIAIALKIKHKLEEIAKKNSQANLKQNQPNSGSTVKHLTLGGRVNERLGKSASTSHETIRKVEKIMKEAPQHIIDKAWYGKCTVNKAFKYIRHQEKIRELEQQATNSPSLELNENVKLYCGDFREICKRIPDNSVDLVYTDPPYGPGWAYIYSDTGVLANRVLKPGGSLVSYVGRFVLPETIHRLGETGLTWWWMFSVEHTGSHERMYAKQVFVCWKPMVWYIKGDRLSEGVTMIEDFVSRPRPYKGLHSKGWDQSPVEAEHVISKLTVKNQIVLDPMMGSGTTGIATLQLDRKFIGVEINETDFKVAEANIANSSDLSQTGQDTK